MGFNNKKKWNLIWEHLSKPQTHDSRQHLNERNCILTWRWIHILVYGERQISIAAWMWIRIFAIEEEPNSRYHFLNQSTTASKHVSNGWLQGPTIRAIVEGVVLAQCQDIQKIWTPYLDHGNNTLDSGHHLS